MKKKYTYDELKCVQESSIRVYKNRLRKKIEKTKKNWIQQRDLIKDTTLKEGIESNIESLNWVLSVLDDEDLHSKKG